MTKYFKIKAAALLAILGVAIMMFVDVPYLAWGVIILSGVFVFFHLADMEEEGRLR